MIEITKLSDLEPTVRRLNLAFLVVGSEHCTHCVAFRNGSLQDLLAEYGEKVAFVWYEADDIPSIFAAPAIPSFYVFQKGEKRAELVGFPNENAGMLKALTDCFDHFISESQK